MRILSRYIIREHVGPFLLSLAVLTFLFLMNFLIEILDMVIGKGLEVQVVVELFIVNIAWMVALTVPMAVLVAVLMAFGRFSHDGEITALKASGVSVFRLMWPVLITGIAIATVLVYFNDRVLPEFNYRAKTLEMNIRAKRPTLALKPGIFLETVDGYRLQVQSTDPATSRVEGITIVQYLNYAPPNPPRIIKARWGTMTFDTSGEQLNLDLHDGTITEVQDGQTRVQTFGRLQTYMNVEGTQLQRSDTGIRGDRELSIADMWVRVADRDSTAARYAVQLAAAPKPFVARVVRGRPEELPGGGKGLLPATRVVAAHKALLNDIQSDERTRAFYSRQASRYLVEIHKKYSIPFACIAFILVGIPLAIMARRGGAIMGFGIALLFFLLYWSCLILGEMLADRNLAAPWLSMWFPNILVTAAGVLLLVRGVHEQRFIDWESLARKLPGRLGRRLGDRIGAGDGTATA